MTTKTILLIIAILFVLDSLFVLLFPKASKRMIQNLARSKTLKTIAVFELIIGVIILVISLLI